MEKLNVALLSGGDSSERVIALQSAAQMEKAFDRDKYNVMVVDIDGRDWSVTDSSGRRWPLDRNDFSVTIDGRKTVFGYAFIVIHGTPGEDGRLQGYLDMMRVPYSSCGFVSTVVTFDKTLCKRAVEGIEGLHLAKEIILRRGDIIEPQDIAATLGLPMFIKPNASGSSFGVTKVKRTEDIAQAVEAAFRESDTVMAEEYIAGREFGCGVILTSEREYLLPVTEIISRNEFFDYEAKYTAGLSDEVTPAEIPATLAARLQSLAASVYRACGCRGLVRADFIVTPDGKPYMIEVNSVPGMSAGSIVPKQLAAAGISIGEMIDIIISDTRK